MMNNVKFMKGLPDGYFDLAIPDPPYGIGADRMGMGSSPKRRDGRGYPSEGTAARLRKNRLNQGCGKLKGRLLNNADCSWDTRQPPRSYWKELMRVSKHQIIWGGNYFKLPPTRCILAWNKLQPWENFSQFELAWTSFDGPAQLFTLSNTGGANAERKIHPTQKPVELYEWLLKKFAKPGWRIFDSHMGSQSSRIAAYNLGLDYWGCENNAQIFKDGCERFERHRQIAEEIADIGYARSELAKVNPTLF